MRTQETSLHEHPHPQIVVNPRIPGNARGYLAYVMSHLGDSQILPLMEAAVEARTELAVGGLTGNRELLYLDLALEDQVGVWWGL